MANEEMIQTHVDNFLAKIAGGATPVDTNVRNSKEFWLDKIADWTGGKSTDNASTKKIYWHTVYFERGGATQATYSRMKGYMIILTNTATPIDATSFTALLGIEGFVGVVINGVGSNTPGSDFSGCLPLTKIVRSTSTTATVYMLDSSNEETPFGITITAGWANVVDLGVNAIN